MLQNWSIKSLRQQQKSGCNSKHVRALKTEWARRRSWWSFFFICGTSKIQYPTEQNRPGRFLLTVSNGTFGGSKSHNSKWFQAQRGHKTFSAVTYWFRDLPWILLWRVENKRWSNDDCLMFFSRRLYLRRWKCTANLLWLNLINQQNDE